MSAIWFWWSGLPGWQKAVIGVVAVPVVVSVVVENRIANHAAEEARVAQEARQAEEARVAQEARRAAMAVQDEEDRRKGLHCLDPWDGNHNGFEEIVRFHLNDPDSMKTYSTKVTPVGEDGNHEILMDFGAKNVFGGIVRHTASGFFSQVTCDAKL